MKRLRKIMEAVAIIITIVACFIICFSINNNDFNYIEFNKYSLVPISFDLKNKNEGLFISETVDNSLINKNDKIVYVYYKDSKLILKSGVIKSLKKQDDGSYVYVIKSVNDKIDNSCVVGKVKIRIPLLGLLINYLLTREGFLLLIVLPLLVVCIFEMFNFIDGIKSKRLKI